MQDLCTESLLSMKTPLWGSVRTLIPIVKGREGLVSFKNILRGGEMVTRWAHNPKIGGSIPPLATKDL